MERTAAIFWLFFSILLIFNHQSQEPGHCANIVISLNPANAWKKYNSYTILAASVFFGKL